jgi:hypothetical protein
MQKQVYRQLELRHCLFCGDAFLVEGLARALTGCLSPLAHTLIRSLSRLCLSWWLSWEPSCLMAAGAIVMLVQGQVLVQEVVV